MSVRCTQRLRRYTAITIKAKIRISMEPQTTPITVPIGAPLLVVVVFVLCVVEVVRRGSIGVVLVLPVVRVPGASVLAALVVVSFVAADVILAVADVYSSVVDTDEKLLGMIHSYCARRNIYHESSRLPGGKRTPLLTDSTTNHPDSSNNY